MLSGDPWWFQSSYRWEPQGWNLEDKTKRWVLFTISAVEERNVTCGTSLAVQWLRFHASTAGGVGPIPGQGNEIPHAPWCGQKIKSLKKNDNCMSLCWVIYNKDWKFADWVFMNVSLPVLCPGQKIQAQDGKCSPKSPPAPLYPHGSSRIEEQEK